MRIFEHDVKKSPAQIMVRHVKIVALAGVLGLCSGLTLPIPELHSVAGPCHTILPDSVSEEVFAHIQLWVGYFSTSF